MQPVMREHQLAALRRAAIADELRRILEPNAPPTNVRHKAPDVPLLDHMIARHIGVARAIERKRFIEERRAIRDHRCSALGVEPFPRRQRPFARDRIRAVQRIVKRSPPCIRGVQRVARIRHRHHELRSADRRNLRIEPICFDVEIRRLGNQISDLA
jgi:hypothetical protein